MFTRHLAGNVQTFDPATSGFYANATDAYDEQQLSGLDIGRFGKTLEDAGLGFDTRFSENVDSFWASAAPLLRENLQTQIRLEAQLRELDLNLDKSNREDLERVLDHPTHEQRLKKFPLGGPVHVYRIALQPQDLILEGCLVITRSPDEDTYKLPALLYQVGRGLEQFASLQALRTNLIRRLDDAVERESLLDLLPQRQRTWSPANAPIAAHPSATGSKKATPSNAWWTDCSPSKKLTSPMPGASPEVLRACTMTSPSSPGNWMGRSVWPGCWISFRFSGGAIAT